MSLLQIVVLFLGGFQVPDSLSFIIITDSLSLSFCCANYHPYNPSEITHNQANIQLKQLFLDME